MAPQAPRRTARSNNPPNSLEISAPPAMYNSNDQIAKGRGFQDRELSSKTQALDQPQVEASQGGSTSSGSIDETPSAAHDPSTAMSGLKIQTDTPSNMAPEDMTCGHKRKASGDLFMDGEIKHARLETRAEQATPCCVKCAMQYNIFPDLVCSRPRGRPDGPCKDCLGSHKLEECVLINARFQPFLKQLQDAAKAFLDNQTVTTEQVLNSAQTKLIKMIKSIRQQQPTSKSEAKSLSYGAIEHLFIQLAFEQDSYATNDLISLRKLPRMRNTLDICGTKKMPSITSLDHTKDTHLEIIAAHLVGKVVDKGCQGFFRECIVVPEQSQLTFLGGVCTNCALGGRSACSSVSL
ncbi:MAG: hypothetical protein Q9223_002986 [Gallowayella weberi]